MFNLVYDFTIEDSIYEKEPYYNDDYYKLYYNNEELFIYDEDDYPSGLGIEIANIRKCVHIIVPYIDDTFRNADIFKQGVEYTINLINKIFANEDYKIDVYYENN